MTTSVNEEDKPYPPLDRDPFAQGNQIRHASVQIATVNDHKRFLAVRPQGYTQPRIYILESDTPISLKAADEEDKRLKQAKETNQ
ncbi:hypothetical protein [Schaalia sp. ZJ1691]|uniref:hypothetical protein n=1 Tax=Schaalia sp. ZJ1691 TaxID=2709404 RepID=UPI0013ED4C10|nr:hypothetical protein [Schaalia sp. ZJ1691]